MVPAALTCKDLCVFDPSYLVRKRAEVTVRTTPTGALLVDLTTGQCWQLNRLGADFLLQLETEKSVQAVCDVLESRYDVSREVLQRDLARLTQELADAGLIERAGG